MPPLTLEEANVALKVSQQRLTDLRRKHLEAEYVPAVEVRGIVVALAEELKAVMKAFPAKLRRKFPKLVSVEFERQIFDFYSQHVTEAAEAIIAKLNIKASRARTSTYSTKPGPKPGSRKRKASA